MFRLSPFLIFGAAAGVCFAQTTSRPAIAPQPATTAPASQPESVDESADPSRDRPLSAAERTEYGRELAAIRQAGMPGVEALRARIRKDIADATARSAERRKAAIARMRDALDARDKARSRTGTNRSGQRVQGTYNFGNSKHWESESKKARDARQAELDRLDNQLAALGRARQKLDLAETCYMAVQEYRCHIRFEQMGRAEATLNRARTAAARLARLDSYSTPHGLSVDSKAGDAKRALARLESALSPSVSESPSPAGPRGRGVDNEEAVETRIRGTR